MDNNEKYKINNEELSAEADKLWEIYQTACEKYSEIESQVSNRKRKPDFEYCKSYYDMVKGYYDNARFRLRHFKMAIQTFNQIADQYAHSGLDYDAREADVLRNKANNITEKYSVKFQALGVTVQNLRRSNLSECEEFG